MPLAPATTPHRTPPLPISIRALRPDDGALVDAVMAGLGERSRYLRFHSPKPRLTKRDRDFLTNVDGVSHLALIALAPDGSALGEVRAVRLHDDPSRAELAAAVVDAHQGEGIGSVLIRTLALRAAAAGIERLTARVLASSTLVRGLQRRGWELVDRDGPSLTLEIDAWKVASAEPPRRPGALTASALGASGHRADRPREPQPLQRAHRLGT
jgi:GNAT superfamily N-acetyltransferase